MEVVAVQTRTEWSDLPDDLVTMIIENLGLYADYVRFCCVCVSWRNSALQKTHNHPYRQRQYFPFVLLPCDGKDDDDEDNNNTNNVALLSINENGKIYYPLSLQSKDIRGSLLCLGSSHGWLVIVDEDSSSPSMYLFNPFTKAQLPLPPTSLIRFLTELNPLSVNKVILSSAPSSSSQIQSSKVVAIAIFEHEHTNQVAFSRPGDKAWTYFPTNHDNDNQKFIDVAFYRDHLYVLRVEGDVNRGGMLYDILVFQMDMGGDGGGGGCPDNPKLVETLEPPGVYSRLGRPMFCRWGYPYMVESCGDLLMVEREEVKIPIPKHGHHCFKACGFKVYKMCLGNSSSDDNKTNSSTWEQIKNLGDRMLFLGVNSSFSLSSHDFPSGCFRGNCIYFTHHYFYDNRYYYSSSNWDSDMDELDMGALDMGVFYLDDEGIELFMPLEFGGHSLGRRFHPSPIWLSPNPN